MSKTAVVLMNLGAPDQLSAVEPFLINLFKDPAILDFKIPQLMRTVLARLIARRRAPFAREIYQQLGGKSPLYENTILQQNALQHLFGDDFSVHIAMRYWHPRAEDLIQEWQINPPERIVLLPLYPQFSTTTSGSSIKEWIALHRKAGLAIPVHVVCCYPENQGFVAAQASLLQDAIKMHATHEPYRILFSAHGLPKRIVDAGDSYPDQVDATARAIVRFLGDDSLDWRVCYQSRVGPVDWIKPYADDEIRQCGLEGKSVVLVPLSFVSEHSETLVELDVEFKGIAEESGVPFYCRVPTVGVFPSFIEALRDLVIRALGEPALSIEAPSVLYTECSKLCNGVRRA